MADYLEQIGYNTVAGIISKRNKDMLDGTVAPVVATVTLPQATGGLSSYRNLDLGVTGAIVKASPGGLYGLYVSNAAVAARYVKLYNKATAPTAGDTPVMTLALPASGTANVNVPLGINFSAGISARATTAIADADTGAPTTNDVVLNLWYA